MNKNYIKFLVIPAIILGSCKTINIKDGICMEDINESNIKTQDYFNDHTVNEIIDNSNKNDLKNINNKQENISE